MTVQEKEAIGNEMIESIQMELQALVLSILDDTTERDIKRVVVELHSNLGEVKEYKFLDIASAIKFLNETELKDMFISTASLTLFDPPPKFADDNET